MTVVVVRDDGQTVTLTPNEERDFNQRTAAGVDPIFLARKFWGEHVTRVIQWSIVPAEPEAEAEPAPKGKLDWQPLND